MKKMFTLAIATTIASLSFAQAPAQKAKVSDRKIQKVLSAEQIQKAMEVQAVREAKAQAAVETSGSILRKAVKRPSAAVAKQFNALQPISLAQAVREITQPRLFTKPGVASLEKTFAQKNETARPKMVANVAAETVDLDMTLSTATYYGAPDYDWFFVFNTNDGLYQFRFDIANQPAEALPLDQEFTLDDMVYDYSWAQNKVTGDYIEYASVTFKATMGAVGKVDYYATVNDTEGNTFNLQSVSAAAPEITSEETWSFSIAETQVADYTADMGLLQIIGDNGEQLAAITLNADQPTGTFTYDDVYGVGQHTIIYLEAADYTGVKCFDLNANVTATGATADYYGENGVLYHINFTFAEGGDEPGDEPTDVTVTKDNNGIITSVAGGVVKSYARSAEGTVYFISGGSVYFAAQSGNVTVVEDGDKVYIKDPVARFTQNSWVEGTKNGNMLIVPAGQPLTYNTTYATTISLRYGVIAANGDINAEDSYAENFVYTIDGNTLTLQNTAVYAEGEDTYFMGAMWDDDDSFAGGECETVLTYDPTYVAPSTDLVVLPAGAEVQAWTMNATSVSSSGSTPVTGQPVNVAVIGSDVYLQGLFEDFATAWVKGTKSGSTVTFAKLQFIGTYSSYDMYFAGTDGEILTDATATLAADGQTITFTTDILANAATDRIYYLTWLQDATISAGPVEEPVITNLTASLPYINGFDTDAEIEQAAVYDANRDGKTFTFTSDSKSGSNVARYAWNSSKAGDDYVVFPGLTLQAGVSYKVSVDARANSATFPERVEVVAGTEAKGSALNISVIPATDLTTGDYVALTADFTPEATGVYYFAIHAISDPDMFYLYADNFSVKENNPNTPLAVTGFTAEAAAEGALSAKLTFTLPSATVGGAALDMVEYAISRDGEEIIQGVAAAGATKTKTDTEAHNGVNVYTIVAKANDLVSDVATVSVFVGEDTPADVENLVAADHNTTVGLTWDAPSEGVNGGYINPANLTYNVYPVEIMDFLGMIFTDIDYENPYATGLTETAAEVEFDTNTGAQGYTYFGVTAENAGGESEGAIVAAFTGAPYDMPVHESFDNGTLSYWWGVDYDDNIYGANGGLGLTEDGELVFDAPVAGWIDLMSGKIALRGADNAGLSFDYNSDAPAVLSVNILTAEGETTVETINVAAGDAKTAKISLAEFAEQTWVRFTVRAEFAEAGALYVDNINVMDFISDNLIVSISAPKNVVAGKSAIVKATVKNEGENAAEGYEVKFYINDVEAAAPMFEAPVLAFYESATFEYELETSIFDQLGDVTVKAEVVYAADLKDADNADETVITVIAPSATPVASVAAEQTEEGILVNWTVAENAAAEVTEDFESYDADVVFADGESCGPWLAADKSQGSTYSWNSGAWNHMGEAYAFGIIDVEAEGIAENFPAASGTKMALFMSEVDENTQMGIKSNKYMISPELPGVAQTISFEAMIITAQYGAEEFEVMVSTTDSNVASFTSVQKFTVEEEGMFSYSAQLPEGAKYFAIHYTSTDIFGLFVDDVKYTTGGGAPTGFNIYVDESLVATTGAEATSYTYAEELAAGEHIVAVSAVYGDNESAPVCATVDYVTGIQNVMINAATEIYTVDGIRVRNAESLKAGVYVVNGKKQVVK